MIFVYVVEFLVELDASHRTFLNENHDESFSKVDAQANEKSVGELMESLLQLGISN